MSEFYVLRLLLPVAGAYLWIRRLPGFDRPEGRNLGLALAVGAGIAVPSALYGATVMAAGPPGPVYAFLETILFAALAILPLRLSRGRADDPAASQETDRPPPGPAPAVLVAVFTGLAVGGGALFLSATIRFPDGSWDAWAVWNLKARFLARGGEWWVHALSPRIGWSSPDYPLLLPGAVARLWPGASNGSPAVPALLGLHFAAGTVALLVAGLSALRGRATGLLAGILLLGTPQFIFQAPAQCADIPLSFFVLASLVCLCLHGAGPRRSCAWLFAAGLAAGCAAWTKNEGLLYCGALATGWMAEGVLRRRPAEALRELGAILAGALPFLALVAWFKFRWAPPSLLFSGLDAETAGARVLDGARHGLILGRTAAGVVRMGSPILLVLLLLRVRGRGSPGPAPAAGWIALAVTGAGIYAVYLLTPLPLEWHLASSVSRLLLQIWPAALFLAALRLGHRDPPARQGRASCSASAPAG